MQSYWFVKSSDLLGNPVALYFLQISLYNVYTCMHNYSTGWLKDHSYGNVILSIKNHEKWFQGGPVIWHLNDLFNPNKSYCNAVILSFCNDLHIRARPREKCELHFELLLSLTAFKSSELFCSRILVEVKEHYLLLGLKTIWKVLWKPLQRNKYFHPVQF